MNIPKVSIVTAVFNGAKYLDVYFNSLLNQSLSDIEIICVNNASTDNSLQILNDYASRDNRIVVINNKENNIGGALNIAIKIAKAKYISTVDQDDWVDLSMYKSLIESNIDESAEMVVSDYFEYFNERDIRKVINIPYESSNTTESIKKYVLLNGGRLFTNLIKKDLFVDHNLFYPENYFYPDNAICVPLYCSAKKITKLNRHLYFYRSSEMSLTRSKDNFRFFDRLETTNMLLINMRKLGLYDKYLEETNYKYYQLFYRNTIIGSIPRFSRFPKKYIYKTINDFKAQNLNFKNNNYYKTRNINYEDFIIKCIELNINMGYIFFFVYKLLIPFKKYFIKRNE